MTIDATQLVVAPGGSILVAPVGTPLPADEIVALNAAFKDCGIVDENGVTLTPTANKVDVPAWQSAYPVKRLTQSREHTIAFALEQWNTENLKLAFDGGQVVLAGGAGHFKYIPPLGSDAEIQRALIIAWTDGAFHYRIPYPKVTLDTTGSIQLFRSMVGKFPITMKVLGSDTAEPFDILTDNPAFVVG